MGTKKIVLFKSLLLLYKHKGTMSFKIKSIFASTNIVLSIFQVLYAHFLMLPITQCYYRTKQNIDLVIEQRFTVSKILSFRVSQLPLGIVSLTNLIQEGESGQVKHRSVKVTLNNSYVKLIINTLIMILKNTNRELQLLVSEPLRVCCGDIFISLYLHTSK